MITPTDPNITGLLLLINRVHAAGGELGSQSIVPLAEMKLPRVAAAYEALIDALRAEQLIIGGAESFTLTTAGLAAVEAAAQRYSLHAWFYNAYYQAVVTSRAHALFCERVYGHNLSQHGMADMEQVRVLLTELQVAASQTLLDFGCGDGQISEYIADTTQTCVTGIDVANEAIALAQARTRDKLDRVKFLWADIERQPASLPPQQFDRIVAIDSLFFLRDQRAAVQLFLDRLTPAGRLGVFYISPPATPAAETPLGRALADLDVTYRVRDFSAENTAHWLKKKHVLLELEAMFKAEGHEFLFKNRLAECDGLEKFQRYLYLITPAR